MHLPLQREDGGAVWKQTAIIILINSNDLEG